MSNSMLVVVDTQYMFHRHLYRIKGEEEKNNGRPMLSCISKVDGSEIETARLYFTMKDLLKIVEFARMNNADLCICLDSKSKRKEESVDYKANRGKLVDRDVEALNNIEKVLRGSGFSVAKEDGYEADDCIAAMVRAKKDSYGSIVIFTPDSDLCCLVHGNVSVKRYKSVYSQNTRGRHVTFMEAHRDINESNLSEMLGSEYGVNLPYNAVALYKATVGDKSDHIPGIKGFGAKAFDKYIAALTMEGVDFTAFRDFDVTEGIIRRSEVLLGGTSKMEEALTSLELVKSRTCDSIEEQVRNAKLDIPSNESIAVQLAEFNITSLV